MNYIKKYSENHAFSHKENVFIPLRNPDIEDLEDYLQEIFDRFAIHKRPYNQSDADDLYASGGSYYWLSDSRYDYITIEKLGYKKSRVIEAILSAKANIEKRLGREIIIETGPMTADWMGISIKKFHYNDAKKRQLNEGRILKPDISTDDLEDYLQETFDRFKIKKSKHNEDPLYPNYFKPKYERGSIQIDECALIFDKLYKELLRIKPLLEKRLGRRVHYSHLSDKTHINIRIVQEGLKRNSKGKFILPKNEATKYPRWTSPKEKLHFLISEIEERDIKLKNVAIPITDEEIKFLIAKLYLPAGSNVAKSKVTPKIEILNSEGRRVFKIDKLEDEWFICTYWKGTETGYIDHNRGNTEIYKCDQMDGLLQCLKYFINKRRISFKPKSRWNEQTPWYMNIK